MEESKPDAILYRCASWAKKITHSPNKQTESLKRRRTKFLIVFFETRI
jgi:hypothetical protein